MKYITWRNVIVSIFVIGAVSYSFSVSDDPLELGALLGVLYMVKQSILG